MMMFVFEGVCCCEEEYTEILSVFALTETVEISASLIPTETAESAAADHERHSLKPADRPVVKLHSQLIFDAVYQI